MHKTEKKFNAEILIFGFIKAFSRFVYICTKRKSEKQQQMA